MKRQKASLDQVIVKAEADMKNKYKTAVILSDMQIPYHDPKAIYPILQLIKDIKPNIIFNIGDMYDFYDVSQFNKDPERIYHLQDEIDQGKDLWKQIKKASPKSELYLKEGNHERRLKKYLMKNQELYSLRSLKLDNVLEIKELGVKVIPLEKDFYLNKNLILIHGDKLEGGSVRQKSAYSANANLTRLGISGISGHTHRLGSTFKTDKSGRKVWYEIGCLANLKPEYVSNPDWQHGFAVVNYGKDFFHVQLVHITEDYNFYYGGKLYNGKNVASKKKR